MAKIQTARRLQAEIGGRIVFFCHDSDHDPRETRTILRHRKTGEPAQAQFRGREQAPAQVLAALLEAHRRRTGTSRTLRQLPNYVDGRVIDVFRKTSAETVSDFCLEMYRRMGLLEGSRSSRSSDPALRRRACAVREFFVDVPYEGEIVRARVRDGALEAARGRRLLRDAAGAPRFTKEQISPTRDTRLRWMQSVIHCTHYVAGAGEQAYLRQEEAPEITFVRPGRDRPIG